MLIQYLIRVTYSKPTGNLSTNKNLPLLYYYELGTGQTESTYLHFFESHAKHLT